MTATRLIQVGRVPGLLAGPLAVASVALVIASEITAGGSIEAMEGSMTGLLGGVLGLAGGIALLVGLIAVCLRHHDLLEGLGLAGFLVAVAGAAMSVGGLWSQVFVVPYLIAEAPDLLTQSPPPVLFGYVLSYGLLGVGALLLSIAALRSRAFPRWTSILAIVGAVLCLAPLPSRYFLFAIAVTVWSAQTAPVETAAPRAVTPTPAV